MRILLWHGYLLRGSGSNIYTANIAKVWRRHGHDVYLMCQERHPEALDFVDELGDFDASNQHLSLESTGHPRLSGHCTVIRPNIGRVLPVYVYDEYEGFDAKRFVDLTDGELARYVDSNVRAMVSVIERWQPDAVITGHEVMGPYIAREACAPSGKSFLAKLHGSALEYAVKEQKRYRRYAIEGLSAAATVVGGSRYMVDEAARAIPGWEDRAVVVNPGCDLGLFQPRPQAKDERVATVGYVGKFIVLKGAHLLLAALPLIEVAGLHAVIVGYGGFDEGLRALADALRAGDIDRVRTIALDEDLDHLVSFIEALGDPNGYAARARGITVEFTGRLDHGPLAELLPTFDVLAVPSILAEAFGMVAAEAAACGVLPVVPAHSGIGEVGSTLESEVDAPGRFTYDPARPIEGLASRVDGLLGLPRERRRELDAAVAAVAHRRWSWERVADDLLRLASAS